LPSYNKFYLHLNIFFMSLPVTYGLIGGFLSILYSTVLYLVNPSLLIGSARYGIYAIFFVAIFVGTYREQNEKNKMLDFKELVRVGFIVFLIANAMQTFYDYTLFSIKPELVEFKRQGELAWIESQRTKMLSHEYQNQIRMVKNTDYRPYFGDIFFGYFVQAIMGFMVSALAALIFSRKQS
jgi:hypothetical protein